MTAPELRLTRLVPAPVEEVFRAWTDPDVLIRWWGRGDHFVTAIELDPRPGGDYRFTIEAPAGDVLVMAGRYVEFDPPAVLSFTWRWEQGGPPPPGVESRVTVTLTPAGEATELLVVHGGFPDAHAAAPYRGGWELTLPKLDTLFR